MKESCWEANTYGFLGCDLKASMLERAEFQREAAQELNLNSLLLLTQVHGKSVAVYRGPSTWKDLPECDAIVAPLLPETRGVALGILTADCVPILLKTDFAVGAIHAGWRGLAAGIVENAIASVLSFGKSSLQVKIGPCAGPRSYEVGAEVIEAIGPHAQYEPAGAKFLLRLQETAAECVRIGVTPHETSATIERVEVCTMTSKDFHSYRRDGNKAGRNLSYILAGL